MRGATCAIFINDLNLFEATKSVLRLPGGLGVVATGARLDFGVTPNQDALFCRTRRRRVFSILVTALYRDDCSNLALFQEPRRQFAEPGFRRYQFGRLIVVDRLSHPELVSRRYLG